MNEREELREAIGAEVRDMLANLPTHQSGPYIEDFADAALKALVARPDVVTTFLHERSQGEPDDQ